jgi:hypothetical protein
VGLIILVLVGGFFLYSLRKQKKGNGDKSKKGGKKEKETVQDLFEYKTISDKGISHLNDGTFTAILEVSEINQRLNNESENTSVWRKFRSLVNALGIRHTFLVQSQYLDSTDFVNDYSQQSDELENLTPQLRESKDAILESYHEFSEIKTKEVRCYAVFRFNPYKEGLEKGLDTGSSVLNSLLEATKRKTTGMTEEEAIDLANSILDEVTDLAYQLFHGIGMKSVRLNRTGVLNMAYMTLNRDLTLAQRLSDAANADSFREFKMSETPFLIENIAEYEELKMQGYSVEHILDVQDLDNDIFRQEELKNEEEILELVN